MAISFNSYPIQLTNRLNSNSLNSVGLDYEKRTKDVSTISKTVVQAQKTDLELNPSQSTAVEKPQQTQTNTVTSLQASAAGIDREQRQVRVDKQSLNQQLQQIESDILVLEKKEADLGAKKLRLIRESNIGDQVNLTV